MKSLTYIGTTGGLIWTAACLPIGFLLIFTAYFLFNRFPAKWYCDYDEEPSEELLGKRVSFKGSGIVFSIAAAICLALCRLQFNKGYDILFVALGVSIIVLLMIILSDFKYTIIPDQFTAAAAVVFLAVVIYDRVRGYNIFSSEWWQPIAGAAIGGGSMLLINALGVIIYKKEGMGFGDVKLFAAVGILTGFPGTIYTLLISLVVASIGFIITLVAQRIICGKKEAAEEASSDDADDDDDIDDIDIVDGVAESTENADGTEGAESTESEVAEVENGEQTEENTRGSYLAFGPYIAAGTIIYICFFDLINSAASMYLGLF